jgi:hypothetical protein
MLLYCSDNYWTQNLNDLFAKTMILDILLEQYSVMTVSRKLEYPEIQRERNRLQS